MNRLSVMLAAASCALLAPNAMAPQAFAQGTLPGPKNVDLGDGLHVIIGQGGNIGVSAGPDGAIAAVDSHVKAGRTLEAAVAAKPLKPWANYAWSFIPEDSFATTLYNGLKK